MNEFGAWRAEVWQLDKITRPKSNQLSSKRMPGQWASENVLASLRGHEEAAKQFETRLRSVLGSEAEAHRLHAHHSRTVFAPASDLPARRYGLRRLGLAVPLFVRGDVSTPDHMGGGEVSVKAPSSTRHLRRKTSTRQVRRRVIGSFIYVMACCAFSLSLASLPGCPGLFYASVCATLIPPVTQTNTTI